MNCASKITAPVCEAFSPPSFSRTVFSLFVSVGRGNRVVSEGTQVFPRLAKECWLRASSIE